MAERPISLLLFRLEDYLDLLNHKDEYSTSEERNEANNYVSPKNDYKLLSYILRRIVLSEYLNCKPSGIKYNYNENGKPYLLNSKLNFSVSLSQKWFLMGLAWNKSIGVDLEVINKISKLNSFINAYVSKEQKRKRITIQGYDKLVMTYLDWCMKESFIKAKGVGIKEDFKKFSYILENPHIDPEGDDYEKHFSWKIEGKYTNEVTSNMHLYRYDEDLALSVSTIKKRKLLDDNSFSYNTFYYKANPNLIRDELMPPDLNLQQKDL